MTTRKNIQGKFNLEALKLTEGPHLAGYFIQHSDANRLLIIDGAIVRFTPTEYSLLLRLLRVPAYVGRGISNDEKSRNHGRFQENASTTAVAEYPRRSYISRIGPQQ